MHSKLPTPNHRPKLISTAALFLVLSLLPSISPAEGIASMTSVTRQNATSLKHHRLDVIRKSQRGKSYVAIEVRPAEGHPFLACSVTIHDGRGERILLQFDPAVGQAPARDTLPGGSRVYFHVTDDLIDGVEVRYHLHANAIQSHVFTIPPGQLAKIANLR